MSLKDWLHQEKLSTCHSGLNDAGVKTTEDLYKLQNDNIDKIGCEVGWNASTRKNLISAVNKLRIGSLVGTARPSRKGRESTTIVSRNKPYWLLMTQDSLQDLLSKQDDNKTLEELRAEIIEQRREKSAIKTRKRKHPGGPVAPDNPSDDRPISVLLKQVKASTAAQNYYLKPAVRMRSANGGDESKEEFERRSRIDWDAPNEAYRDRVLSIMPCISGTRMREHAIDPSAQIVDLYDIPDRFPQLNNLQNCCDAMKYELIDCQNPDITTDTQITIGQEVQKFWLEITDELINSLTQDHNIVSKMKNQIEQIEKFTTLIAVHRSELEQLYEQLQKKRPIQETDLLRRMDDHRDFLATHADVAEEYLSALTQLAISKEKLTEINSESFGEFKKIADLPLVLKNLITGVCIIFGLSKPSIDEAISFMSDSGLQNKLLNFDPKRMDLEVRAAVTQFIMDNQESFDPERVASFNHKAVLLAEWVEGVDGLLGVYSKLAQYSDGANILKQIETAYSDLRHNKSSVAKTQQEDICYLNVLDQVRWNIDLMKQCEDAQMRITTRRAKMIKRLVNCEALPVYTDIILPDGYVLPYDKACSKVRTQFGELTEMEIKFVFLAVKKHFILLTRLYKTFASFEGKNGQGLLGISSLIWGICCKAMWLEKVCADDPQDYIYEIFNSSVKSTESRTDELDFSTLHGSTVKEVKLEHKEEHRLNGVWKCGESTTRYWTLESKPGDLLTGFIGSEEFARIDGEIVKENHFLFNVKWGKMSDKSGMTAKCKATQVDGATIRVRYLTSNRKKGYWILQKTGEKVRVQNRNDPSLQYDSFVEAIIRLSIYIWTDIPAWEAIEALIEGYIIPNALGNWDVVPESDDSVMKYYDEEDIQFVLKGIFDVYGTQRRDKKRGKLLTFSGWENLVRKVNRNSSGNCKPATFRTMQFAFFTSKEMFPHDGPLNELTFIEFTSAVARLAFMMVQGIQQRTGRTATKPLLLNQCETLVSKLKDVLKHESGMSKEK